MADEATPGSRDRMRGYYMAICIAILSPVGIVLWLVLENPGFIGIGPAIGVAIGASLEGRNTNQHPDHGGGGLKSAIVLALGCLVAGLLLALMLLR